jgi:hypothetical protein
VNSNDYGRFGEKYLGYLGQTDWLIMVRNAYAVEIRCRFSVGAMAFVAIWMMVRFPRFINTYHIT